MDGDYHCRKQWACCLAWLNATEGAQQIFLHSVIFHFWSLGFVFKNNASHCGCLPLSLICWWGPTMTSSTIMLNYAHWAASPFGKLLSGGSQQVTYMNQRVRIAAHKPAAFHLVFYSTSVWYGQFNVSLGLVLCFYVWFCVDIVWFLNWLVEKYLNVCIGFINVSLHQKFSVHNSCTAAVDPVLQSTGGPLLKNKYPAFFTILGIKVHTFRCTNGSVGSLRMHLSHLWSDSRVYIMGLHYKSVRGEKMNY